MQESIDKALRLYLQEKGYTQFQLLTAMFDMDGVLFDSMKNHSYSWHHAMKHFGFNLPREEAYLHEGRTGAGTINIVSMRERGREATEEEIKAIYQLKTEIFNHQPKALPMPGAHQLLQQVKASGITPMVVTGSGQKTLLERIERSYPGIFQPELMVTAFDVKYGKPNPEPYLMGLQKGYQHFHPNTESEPQTTPKQLSPNNSIVIENAPLGVQAGVASGVFTIAVNTGPIPDSALLDQGANLLFPSMQALSDAWPTLFHAFQTVSLLGNN